MVGIGLSELNLGVQGVTISLTIALSICLIMVTSSRIIQNATLIIKDVVKNALVFYRLIPKLD